MAAMKRNTSCWSDEQLEGLAKAFDLMNAWRFHAAHEHFEALWRVAVGPERRWLHGLAQGAASLHQLTLGRGAAAVRTWRRARLKLEGLPLEPFMTRVDALHQALGLGAEGPRFFDAELLRAHSLPRLDAATLHPPSS
jgi:hypothetical protein